MVQRYYYQCRICLSTFTTEEILPRDARCVCDGSLRYMGPVRQDIWLRVEERPACDGRCISARGPNCDCRCGGENHGKGVMATIVREGGKVVVRPPDDEALMRAMEFRSAVDEAKSLLKEIYGNDYEDYVNGRWCYRYYEINRWITQLQKIYKYRRHNYRMQKLNELIDALSEFRGEVSNYA